MEQQVTNTAREWRERQKEDQEKIEDFRETIYPWENSQAKRKIEDALWGKGCVGVGDWGVRSEEGGGKGQKNKGRGQVPRPG